MRGRAGRRPNDEADIRAVELQPDFKTIQVCLVEDIKGHLDGHKMFECVLYLRQYCYSGSAQTAVRVCSNRQEERKITPSEAAPNELKLGEGRQSDESSPSARRCRRGSSSGAV